MTATNKRSEFSTNSNMRVRVCIKVEEKLNFKQNTIAISSLLKELVRYLWSVNYLLHKETFEWCLQYICLEICSFEVGSCRVDSKAV